MRERVVSSGRFSTRIRGAPRWFTVPAKTFEPGSFSTGSDSPVKVASSAEEEPSTITPSTAKRSPGNARTSSPTAIASIGTRLSTPARTTVAVSGRSWIRDSIDRAVRSIVIRSSAPLNEKRERSTAPSPQWPRNAEPIAATIISRLMSSCRARRFRMSSRPGPKAPVR